MVEGKANDVVAASGTVWSTVFCETPRSPIPHVTYLLDLS